MKERSYSFGELRKVLQESKNEFKPKLGPGVEEEDKKNNRKAYRNAAVRSEETPKPTGKSITHDVNKGMTDLVYDDGPSEQFKKNAQAGLEGYTSELDRKNHSKEPLANASRGSKELVKDLNDKAKEKEEVVNKDATYGIRGHNMPPKEVAPHNGTTIAEEKIDTLKFKHIQFISESQMITHVPDEYKVDGKKFRMKDCKGNRYLVEWHCDSTPDIEAECNTEAVNESLDRMRQLFDYGYKNSKTTNSMRMNEDSNMEKMLGQMRTYSEDKLYKKF